MRSLVFRRDSGIEIKSPDQVTRMRAAGLLVARTLETLRAAVAPGVTTAQLDALAEERIRAGCGVPSFKGYFGFPASICASVNDEIVHGIPGGRVLHDGDVVSLDCGAIVDGWHGDAAISVPVGDVDPVLLELLRACEEAMWRGIAAARVGGRVGDIGAAIEDYAHGQGTYGIVQEYVGHGIGTRMHMEPQVPNYARRGHSPRLREGMALAVEPMLTLGRRETRVLDDDWTVVTADGSAAAHWEHTVALTAEGPWVLTAIDGGAGRLSALGAGVSAG